MEYFWHQTFAAKTKSSGYHRKSFTPEGVKSRSKSQVVRQSPQTFHTRRCKVSQQNPSLKAITVKVSHQKMQSFVAKAKSSGNHRKSFTPEGGKPFSNQSSFGWYCLPINMIGRGWNLDFGVKKCPNRKIIFRTFIYALWSYQNRKHPVGHIDTLNVYLWIRAVNIISPRQDTDEAIVTQKLFTSHHFQTMHHDKMNTWCFFSY